MAEAYTVFSNDGVRVALRFLRSIEARSGDTLETVTPQRTNVLDPRVAYVITDMLESVLREGTAAGAVGARFSSPAAGKTGSSHDAWFAGYTSNLLCLIWVGNDDYTDIKLDGARAAAPIWTEFMLRAEKLRRYSDMKPFTAPAGVLPVAIDKASNLPADHACPDDYQVYFIDGTIPAATCDHPEGPSRNIFQKIFGLGSHRQLVIPPVTQPNPATPAQPAAPNSPPQATNPTEQATPPPQQEEKPKKRGFWKRVFGVGKD